jgi:hypothetical protein
MNTNQRKHNSRISRAFVAKNSNQLICVICGDIFNPRLSAKNPRFIFRL